MERKLEYDFCCTKTMPNNENSVANNQGVAIGTDDNDEDEALVFFANIIFSASTN
jgi:hypothetical protein